METFSVDKLSASVTPLPNSPSHSRLHIVAPQGHFTTDVQTEAVKVIGLGAVPRRGYQQLVLHWWHSQLKKANNNGGGARFNTTCHFSSF